MVLAFNSFLGRRISSRLPASTSAGVLALLTDLLTHRAAQLGTQTYRTDGQADDSVREGTIWHV